MCFPKPFVPLADCAKRSRAAELQEIYNGLKLPYVFTGPDHACNTIGCKHGYWGSRCRQALLAVVAPRKSFAWALPTEALPWEFVSCSSQNISEISVRCRFDGRFSPACKLADRQKVTSWLAMHAKNGSRWASDILTLKPCDLWPHVRGRTTWIIGDSLSQACCSHLRKLCPPV